MKSLWSRYGDWFILVLAVVLLFAMSTQAEAIATDSETVNAEGRLGSVSSSMALYPGEGFPLYPGDEKWQAGLENPARSLRNFSWQANVAPLLYKDNNLYIGGYFTQAGSQPANNIARWDGSAWHNLGDGVNGVVQQLAAVGSDVYVAGNFTRAGDQAVNNLARWDGSAWHNLNSGLDGNVYKIASLGSNLYVGGSFTQAGGQSASNIARWDGSTWHSLSGGVNGAVYQIAAVGSDLYVAGYFSLAGGQPANNIARWDGSAWHSLDTGVNGAVNELLSTGGSLYAVGDFTQAGSQPANRVARWDGISWHSMSKGATGSVREIAALANDLYIVERLEQPGTKPTDRVARWDGSTWQALGGGSNSFVNEMLAVGNDLYVSGSFTTMGGQPANGIAHWDGSVWHNLAGGVSDEPGSIDDFAVKDNTLYAVGNFTQAGNQALSHVARWDGYTWQPLGQGVSEGARKIVVNNNLLCVGGYFDHVGDQTVNSIACWDGTAWQDLNGGLMHVSYPGTVGAMAALNGSLYVGGHFTQAGNQPAVGIASWDGSAWHDLGGGVWDGTNTGYIRAFAVLNGNLYAAGAFDRAGSQSANGIAYWDGAAWYPLGTGLTGINALAVWNNSLYAGGSFIAVDGQTLNGMARWDGSHWQPVGSGLSREYYWGVSDLWAVPGGLYAAGIFTEIVDAHPANGVAFWDGSAWSRLGSGVTDMGVEGPKSSSAASVAAIGNEVYLGGSFDNAGNKPSPGFAIWHINPELALSYPNGAPGSVFTLSGQYFKANTIFTININGAVVSGSPLGTTTSLNNGEAEFVTDQFGRLVVNLQTTSDTVPGAYNVQVVTDGESSGTTMEVAENAPVRQPVVEAEAEIPLGNGLLHHIYLPAIKK